MLWQINGIINTMDTQTLKSTSSFGMPVVVYHIGIMCTVGIRLLVLLLVYVVVLVIGVI